MAAARDSNGRAAATLRSGSHVRGIDGETRAARFLVDNGLEILDKNFRTRRGEVDIIARTTAEQVVFVEVKTWRRMGFAELEFAIDARKQHRIRTAARHFLLHRFGTEDVDCRFDVCFVKDQQVTWIPHAF